MASDLRTQSSEVDAQKELVLVLLATRIEAGRKTGFFYLGALL